MLGPNRHTSRGSTPHTGVVLTIRATTGFRSMFHYPEWARRRHLLRTRTLLTPAPKNRTYMLLRKEVIQPHLPVRLPCYDLVPIASPTFDGSPHKG